MQPELAAVSYDPILKSYFRSGEEQPTGKPFAEFIIKIAGRCNLNCSYCYMYNAGDRSFLEQPKIMPEAVWRASLDQIVAHAQTHKLPVVYITLHGGEPLLFGKARFRKLVKHFSEAFRDAGIHMELGVQTNAVLIDQEWLEIFKEFRVSAGVSLDGTREHHDKFRVDHHGKGSFDEVLAGIRMLNANDAQMKGLFGGALCVINPEMSTREFWDFICVERLPGVDLLMPLKTHTTGLDHPPATIGTWLCELFDLWVMAQGEHPRISMFESTIGYLLNSNFMRSTARGTDENYIVVIESDGGIEPLDSLKVCGERFTKIDLNVLRDSFDDAMLHPLIQIARKVESLLSETCQTCDLLAVCGGGDIAERFDANNGFGNPSVYCEDYKLFYAHVRHWIDKSVPVAVQAKLKSQFESQVC